MSDFQITGVEDMLKLSKALKQAGRGELRKSLSKGMQAGVKPLIPLTRAEARATLPQAGGLADLVAKAPQRVQVRTGEMTAGVRLVVGNSKSGARAANAGLIRHRVFGTDRWVEQRVPGGWFDRICAEQGSRLALPALEAAMQAVVDEIVKGAH